MGCSLRHQAEFHGPFNLGSVGRPQIEGSPMFIQSATAIQCNAQSIGSIPASVNGFLFADCPELVGASMRYARDEEIYGEGEEAEFVYMVVKGAVRTYKLLSDGRRQIGGFHL